MVDTDDTCPSTHTIRCTLARGHDGPHTAFRMRVSWTGDVDTTARLRELRSQAPSDFTPDGWTLAVFGQHRDDCPAGPLASKRHSWCDCGLSAAIEELNGRVSLLSPLRPTPQEGTTDDVTRIGELAVQPPPQHAPTDREDS